ncbi:ERF017 protein [Hibiscus syriacus]|uniref:ERF017 protein n=1 Tax=Hibiscus syriacus TaxID=106335 RepID=A0A6A2XHD6_HIBSY|nr:ethylene-responsive transcription factor ERF017-like [Hibiscus syriacus]KAE8669180.1 ERF017 protein [Hibiscus syriacus]
MAKQGASQSPASERRSHSQYKGARKRKWGKWVSEIRLPNSRERIWLGSYDTPEKAARAFDAALFCLRGRSAKLNFPDNPPEIADGRSLTPSEIQAVAARFANSDPPRTQKEPPSPSVRLESEFAVEGSFLDVLTKGSGYGIFPEWDEFSGEFLGSTIPDMDCEEDTVDGVLDPESFLWNF